MIRTLNDLANDCRFHLQNGFSIVYTEDGKLKDIETTEQLDALMDILSEDYSDVVKLDCEDASETFRELPFGEFWDMDYYALVPDEDNMLEIQFGVWK